MKTAVEQLMIDLFGENFRITINDSSLDVFQVALEKEKEQMFHSFYAGGGVDALEEYEEEFNKYYNETYQNK